jgi:hypothetical protein
MNREVKNQSIVPLSRSINVSSISRILSFRITRRGSHFSKRPTHPVSACAEWSGQLCVPIFPKEYRNNGTYVVLHQTGFLLFRWRHRNRLRDHRHCWRCGGLLHHLFTCFSIFLRRKIGMYVFCDTIRSGGILPAEPSLIARRLALRCPDFPPSARSGEQLPDEPSSASGLLSRVSHMHMHGKRQTLACFYNCIGVLVSMPRFASLSASLFCSLGT